MSSLGIKFMRFTRRLRERTGMHMVSSCEMPRVLSVQSFSLKQV